MIRLNTPGPVPKPVKEEKQKQPSKTLKTKKPDKPVVKMTSETYKQLWQSQDRKKKKYHNKSKIYTSAIHGTKTFDSIKEANYCEELDWRLRSGEIVHYDMQYKIDIKINGKHWRNYYIDFKVKLPDGFIQYVEVKGYETEVWKMKWAALVILKNEILEPESELIVIK